MSKLSYKKQQKNIIFIWQHLTDTMSHKPNTTLFFVLYNCTSEVMLQE